MHNDQLTRFNIQAEKFQKHAAFFRNLKVEIKANDQTQGAITLFGVSEESLISVIVHFRPFYMKDSEINYITVAEQILGEQTYRGYHDKTSKFLSTWKGLIDPNRDNVGGISLTIGDNQLNVKKNFDIWINEAYLHPEKYKPGSNKGLDSIKSHPMIEGLSKFTMVDLLQRLTALIIGFNVQVVTKILSEAKIIS